MSSFTQNTCSFGCILGTEIIEELFYLSLRLLFDFGILT